MAEDRDYQLIEIYKLHADLADRVSQRRATAIQLHTSILGGLIALIGLLVRINPDESISNYMAIAGFFGLLVCASWLYTIFSYKQLNSIKFEVIHKLEEKLPFQFFAEEWKHQDKYPRLTIVERTLPIAFGLLFLGFLVYGLASALCFEF
ncbi:MAG: hypothetical protein OXF76_20040 [Caldilineaceae bacterium]|nr:hypothetical protein [Caldilineaceae bacterium]